MVRNVDRAPDWRDAAAYAPLLAADRSIIAWEWLRRDPGYNVAAAAWASGARKPGGHLPGPEPWGLHAFESPDLAAPVARPVWRAEAHPFVLSATVDAVDNPMDGFDLKSFGEKATLIEDLDCERVLFSDGLRAIRLDILSNTLKRGPVRPQFLIAGISSAEAPLLSLRRFLSLCRTGSFSATLHPPESKAPRLVLMLRAHDALAAGASQREIASVLLSAEAGQLRWRVNAPSLRSRVQRLARNAEIMAGGAFRSLLGS